MSLDINPLFVLLVKFICRLRVVRHHERVPAIASVPAASRARRPIPSSTPRGNAHKVTRCVVSSSFMAASSMCLNSCHWTTRSSFNFLLFSFNLLFDSSTRTRYCKCVSPRLQCRACARGIRQSMAEHRSRFPGGELDGQSSDSRAL